MKRPLIAAILFALGVPAFAQTAPAGREVTVRLFTTLPPPTLRIEPTNQPVSIRPCRNCAVQSLTNPLNVSARDSQLLLENESASQPNLSAARLELSGAVRISSTGAATFALRGPLNIEAKQSRLLLTVRMSLEDYVAAVLAGESGGITSVEALKAMSIVARTYAVRFAGRHRGEGFDFCDTTHCQDARFSAESPRLRAAVNDTEGELLWHEGRPAAAFYHRDCGGLTEAAQVAWPYLRAPYLRQTQDTFCTARGRASWHSEVSFDQLRAALLAVQIRAPQKLTNVVVIERTPSGRVAKLRLDAHNSSSRAIRIAAEPFRRAIGFSLGWEKLRSDLYDVTISGDKIRFSGHGAGHGVGLCQLGAARMGELGRSYADILSFYYPGTQVGLTASGLDWQILGDERLRLFTTLPATDQSILLVATRALREAEHLAGWKLSGGAQLRVFPTIDAYRNTTGQPGWVAASTRGRTIRLQPFNKLSSMNTLERTLRHEFLHVLVESRAKSSLPLWFREGLVLVLKDKKTARENLPVTLNDAEMERMLEAPQSRAEHERAYRLARARVLMLVQKYGREAVIGWLERGLPRDAR